MSTTVTVCDRTTNGETLHQLVLELLTDRVTVRELIRSRVYQEVQDYNVRSADVFRGLVKPTEAEQVLNGYKLAKGRRIDWEEQYRHAIDAFGRNGFLILVDDAQVEELDQVVEIKPGTDVAFIKLTQLVGG